MSYFTVVRNLDKVRRPFGYLGRYGRDVSAGCEFVVEGPVEAQPDFNERKRQSLVRDQAAGRVLVTLVPATRLRAPKGPPCHSG